MIETLEEAFAAEPDRKCFKLIGGVLTERTVKDVLPELQSNYTQASALRRSKLDGGEANRRLSGCADQGRDGELDESVQEVRGGV